MWYWLAGSVAWLLCSLVTYIVLREDVSALEQLDNADRLFLTCVTVFAPPALCAMLLMAIGVRCICWLSRYVIIPVRLFPGRPATRTSSTSKWAGYMEACEDDEW
jgi:hypothetical protein